MKGSVRSMACPLTGWSGDAALSNRARCRNARPGPFAHGIPLHARRYRLTGIALAVVATVAFALRPVLIKIAYGYVRDPITLIALRMMFSLPFFLAAALWSARGGRMSMLSFRELLTVFGLGAIGYYLASTLDFVGLQYVSAGVGRLLLFLYPTIVVLLSAAFFKKPIRCMYSSLSPVGLKTERSLCSLR